MQTNLDQSEVELVDVSLLLPHRNFIRSDFDVHSNNEVPYAYIEY
jgi:hypothetical protein